jgi:hypothetical protein
MKIRLPGFLTPRRKYEVDESQQIVIFGRAKLRQAQAFMGQVFLIIQWRRRPKPWELSFVVKMKSIESRGISFSEVLRKCLPNLFGEAPSQVLYSWVGKKARTQPKHFAKEASKMFGGSAKSVLSSLEKTADADKLLNDKRPVEHPMQALFDSVRNLELERSRAAFVSEVPETRRQAPAA